MNGYRFGVKRILAILLCVMLSASSIGTMAFAGEAAPAQAGAEEAYDGGASASLGEEEYSAADEAEIPENEENTAPAEEAVNPEDEDKAAPVEEPYEGDTEGNTEETDTLIEAPLSDEETMATDNEAASDTVLNDVHYVERSWNGTKVVSTDRTADGIKPVPSDGNMTIDHYISVRKESAVNLVVNRAWSLPARRESDAATARTGSTPR